MNKISLDQRRTLSDFLGNIGVAWFATGFIMPFFSGAKEFSQLIVNGFLGMSGALIFILSALFLSKERKYADKHK